MSPDKDAFLKFCCLQMREKYKKGKNVLLSQFFSVFSRHESKLINMKKVSSDIRWFCDQLRVAELILSNALEKAEEFSDYDKQLVDKIEWDVQMVDLTLLQLLSPIAPR